MTIKEFKNKYQSTTNPHDLDLLLEFVLHKNREELLIHPESKISFGQLIKLKYFIQQLKKDKPIDYILRKKEFYGLDFKVNKHTLIPRPETEQIIDLVRQTIVTTLQNNPQINLTLLDLGTGSGNIIITLAKYIQGAHFYASDISKQALTVAKVNAQYHQVRIKFVQGSLLQPFQKLLTTKLTTPVVSGCCSNISAHCGKLSSPDIQKKVLIITANLPYLSAEIYQNTDRKVKDYEPKSALVSGRDGLHHYRKLLSELKNLFDDQKFSFRTVYLLLEISPEQQPLLAQEIPTLIPSAKISFHKDLAQKWRVVIIKIAR